MSTMYELTADYLAVLAMAQDPESSADAIADTLEAIEGEIEVKAQNTAIIMKELEADAAKLKTEEERLNKRRKALESNIEAIKKRLYQAMKTTNKPKFKTALFSFRIQKNAPKLVIDAPDKVPKKYLIPQPPKVDNAGIKEFLKTGKCKYAHLEQGESLRIE